MKQQFKKQKKSCQKIQLVQPKKKSKSITAQFVKEVSSISFRFQLYLLLE